MNDASFPKFRSFYDSLVRTGTSRGISLADAQDIAGDAVERALSAFDPAKGEFSAFCRAIFSNLMKNHWRDKKWRSPTYSRGSRAPERWTRQWGFFPSRTTARSRFSTR